MSTQSDQTRQPEGLAQTTGLVDPIAWKSTAWWPANVFLGNEENTSDDLHGSYQQAAAVCARLRFHGLGGDGRIFPLKTRVDPVFPPNTQTLRTAPPQASE